MSVWDALAARFSAAARGYKAPFLAPEHVDAVYDAAPIAEGTAYCRFWLVEMRLAKGIDWFTHRYPVVYANTRYEYDGKLITIPYVAGVEYFKEAASKHLDRVTSFNYPLTPLFPYARGLVELKAGLFSLPDSDTIGSMVSTMGKLAGQLPVPELSRVIDIIQPMYAGISEMLEINQSRLELGYQQAFSAAGGGGSNDLRAGYFAAILADASSFQDNQLRVVGDRLHYLGADSQPTELTGYSYMLLRLERREAQDWEALSRIKELVERAQDAVDERQTETANQIMNAIRVAVARSPDIVRQDRKMVFAKIEAELRERGLQGARGDVPRRSLFQIMRRPAPPLSAEAEAEWVRLSEALGVN